MKLARHICDLLALIRKQPRTTLELALVTERNLGGIQHIVDVMHEEGHVYICEYRRTGMSGMKARVYAFQPTPHELPDAAK